MADTIFDIKGARINEEYLVLQMTAMRKSAFWTTHKARIASFDRTYAGQIGRLTSEENTLPEDEPYIENKLKNAAHDIKRLSREARGVPVFAKQSEGASAITDAKLRGAACDTIWEEGGGADLEGQFYLDIIRGGFAAVACFQNKNSDYAQALRLDPAMAYPTVANGKLRDMVYIESMKERVAAAMFPDIKGLDSKPTNTKNVELVMIFTKEEVVQGLVKDGKATMVAKPWKHKLGVVPVAFRAFETADGEFHGLLDQLSGPMKGRNRAVRLMLDFLEDMVDAGWEEKGIENPPDDGGPPMGRDAVYHHSEDAEGETFIRRIPPGAPAGAVFGLVQYLDSQEQAEGFQPPSRVGVVRQSQASGSFVESTQGSLSSVVIEMQGYVALLRRDWNKIAMAVEEKWLDREKPLMRAVGNKLTYLPSRDFAGWYHHKVMFGAAAGMDRAAADTRILQHLGASIIDLETARSQIDYIEDDTNLQDDVDRDLLGRAMFQRLVNDQTVTFADLAELDQEMGKGKSRRDALKKVLPRLIERQQQAATAQAEAGGIAQTPGPGAAPVSPEEEQLALQKGATPGAEYTEFQDLQPLPQSQFISS